MGNSVAACDQDRLRTRYERQAKVEPPVLTLRENRAEYGRVLKRTRELAGMNRDEVARALGNVDPAQVTRWENGDENPQTWRYRRNPTLKAAYKLAQGEADGAVLELREVITLAQKVSA